jgi:hypothetical protein
MFNLKQMKQDYVTVACETYLTGYPVIFIFN